MKAPETETTLDFRYRVRNKQTGEIVYQTNNKTDAYGHGFGLDPDIEIVDTRRGWARDTEAAQHAEEFMRLTNEHLRGHRDLDYGEMMIIARKLAESVLADTELAKDTTSA
jgi:hypothetical protein